MLKLFSKTSIFLYLSILSLIGVYFFAFGKTNNFIKSISFVLFYLAIKFQIIGLPPHTSLFDEPQNPPLISHAEQRPVSNMFQFMISRLILVYI